MLLLKKFNIIIFLVIGFSIWTKAQQADTLLLKKDSISLQKDSTSLQKDSSFISIVDTSISNDNSTITIKQLDVNPLEKLLLENKYLNSKGIPVSLAVKIKNVPHKDSKFYLLAILILFFGIIKKVYDRYFSTLIRVFFNSSLRQSQLTDQLLQSKLPSLFFNIIFILAGAFYVYFLLQNISTVQNVFNWKLLGFCLLAFFIVYVGKFLTLKFVGWVTGFTQEADTYIFVVFLINKIIGICLLPVIIMLAFSLQSIVNIVMVLSFLLIGVMLLLRFFRSYSLLKHKLKVSSFHFMLYIFSLEILPLLIIYKAVEVFILKKL